MSPPGFAPLLPAGSKGSPAGRDPRPGRPALTAQGSTPPHCGPAAYDAAGDALVNEGVPVLPIGAVVHGIPPDVRPIHGCRTEGE